MRIRARILTATKVCFLRIPAQDVMEAYDVLSDEERRCSWERLRENMKGGGGGQAAMKQVMPTNTTCNPDSNHPRLFKSCLRAPCVCAWRVEHTDLRENRVLGFIMSRDQRF